jgi:isopropylmalate/homocitrate/citramalate synthase
VTYQVKRTWGKNICDKAWGGGSKAVVSFWMTHNRLPSDPELDEALSRAKSLSAKDRFSEVTPDDVVRAFDNGIRVSPIRYYGIITDPGMADHVRMDAPICSI